MKEQSISTTKLFELNCLVTAIAVAMRCVFYLVQEAEWTPIVVDGFLASFFFVFYALTRYAPVSLTRLIQWDILTKQLAITGVWIFWGDWNSIWALVFALIILIYMLVLGELRYRQLALLQSSLILSVIAYLQWQGDDFALNYRQNWASYTHMTLYISAMVVLLLGIVNSRVAEERRRSQLQANVLRQARKAAEQRRDLLMHLKDLQSDFFLEQDLQPSFNKLLQQLLEVTNSDYGFMGELYIDRSTLWETKPHAHVLSPLFGQLPKAEQYMRFSAFFKQVYEGSVPIINNKMKETIPLERQYGLSNYLGIPVTYNYKVVGAIVLANRIGGYNETIIEELSPFISTYGSIIQNIRLKRAQKKYENELRQAKELAEQSNRLKSQFLTNISHELRTPLSLILGPIDLLQQSDYKQLGEAQWRQQLHLIEKNSKKMLSYIEDIVDLSKLNSDSLEVKPSTINLTTFLEQIYQRTKKEYAHRALPFTLEHQLPATTGLHIDADKLEKIIDNFLSNAFKYTRDGPKEYISLQVKQLENELQISCCDSGAGIPQEHFERIFNRFYQIEQPNKSIFSGTGVGLALCKELSVLLGSTITLKSRVGAGSCFILHLPIDKWRKVAPPMIEKVNTDKAIPAVVSHNSPIEKKKSLLIVEDNRDMRAFLKQILQGEYEVVVKENGRVAWAFLQEYPQRFELIITDLMMPEMDGYTLVQHLQTSTVVNHLPIIVLTANAQFDERLRNLRIGMDDYLTKPFEVEELQVMVKHLLASKASREKR